MRAYPPRFSEVTADHMTLEWKPTSQARGLPVGRAAKLRVEGFGFNEQVQAVSVVTVEANPRHGHITISRRQEVECREAGELSFSPVEPMTLDGMIGVGLVLGGVDEEALPEAITHRARALQEGQPGQSETFQDLTDSQRMALHALADRLGLDHRSEGKKGTRHRKLILTLPKGKHKMPVAAPADEDCKRTVVKDAKKFAAIFGEVPGQQLHGRLQSRGEIAWEPGVAVPQVLERLLGGGWRPEDRLVVVLRGFPGSGKSSLAAMLRRRLPSAQVISADDHWTGKEGVQTAHETCKRAFADALSSAQPVVVVDNTNVRRADYGHYLSAAAEHGYAAVVLELSIDTTSELEQLRRRSLHDVPGGAVGAMWARWEQDPDALRLKPHLPQALLKWLQEQGFVGHPPHTHLIMPTGPFLSVPQAARAAFYERHAAEWDRNHISEIAQPQGFQLFFDIDGLSFEDLLPALPSLRALVGAPLVLTGLEGPPPGYHIFAPGKVVDPEGAHKYRQAWLDAYPGLDKFVDDNLYRSPQLRLLGSRKISKDAVDTGRVHTFLGRFDAEWTPAAAAGPEEAGEEESRWAWHEVSIHPPGKHVSGHRSGYQTVPVGLCSGPTARRLPRSDFLF